MPEAVQTPSQEMHSRGQSQWLTLNTDGQPHRVLTAFTVFTLILGVVAFVLGLIVRAHVAATVVGIAAFVIGLGTQLNSATRGQRVLIVTGIIGGFVGMALGIGHGGFS